MKNENEQQIQKKKLVKIANEQIMKFYKDY